MPQLPFPIKPWSRRDADVRCVSRIVSFGLPALALYEVRSPSLFLSSPFFAPLFLSLWPPCTGALRQLDIFSGLNPPISEACAASSPWASPRWRCTRCGPFFQLARPSLSASSLLPFRPVGLRMLTLYEVRGAAPHPLPASSVLLRTLPFKKGVRKYSLPGCALQVLPAAQDARELFAELFTQLQVGGIFPGHEIFCILGAEYLTMPGVCAEV